MSHHLLRDEAERNIALRKAGLLSSVASVQSEYHRFCAEEDYSRASIKLQILDRSVERLNESIRELSRELECYSYHDSEANR